MGNRLPVEGNRHTLGNRLTVEEKNRLKLGNRLTVEGNRLTVEKKKIIIKSNDSYTRDINVESLNLSNLSEVRNGENWNNDIDYAGIIVYSVGKLKNLPVRVKPGFVYIRKSGKFHSKYGLTV